MDHRQALSLNKSLWVLPECSVDDVALVKQRFDVPEIVARLLCQRGVTLDQVESFLSPTLRRDFPSPFSLKGMADMAEDVAVAIENAENFAIFGDFDVDGATSSAVLYRFLKAAGREAQIYIPDRLSEGYGPNIDALKQLRDQGCDVLMMLDCGTTAFDIVKAGTDLGLKIIILDHHEAEDHLPACWHVINPKRQDDESGLDMLAAVGVTFMACVAINNRLRERQYYTKNAMAEPNVKALLDIVALGTVCDMVPLTGVNRLFVRMGFAVPPSQLNIGIQALMEVAGISAPISTYDCGFVLGPRINAGSRVHQADLGARLLSSDDAEECRNISWTLNDCNDKRKAIQKDMESQAIDMVESQNMHNAPMILVGHDDWHAGLSGLVAGQLKEKYQKPSCVVTYAETLAGKREGRGSGRSIAGIHIAQAFIDARLAGLVEKGGGHAMAGGFTVEPDKVDALHTFLSEHIQKQMESTEINVTTDVDAILTLAGVTVPLVEMLQNNVGPFGQGQPEPLFLFKNIRIHKVDIRGGSHISIQASDWEGGTRVKAMAFRSVDTPIGDALLNSRGRALDLVGRLTINEWQGRKTAEIHVKDLMFSSAMDSLAG